MVIIDIRLRLHIAVVLPPLVVWWPRHRYCQGVFNLPRFSFSVCQLTLRMCVLYDLVSANLNGFL